MAEICSLLAEIQELEVVDTALNHIGEQMKDMFATSGTWPSGRLRLFQVYMFLRDMSKAHISLLIPEPYGRRTYTFPCMPSGTRKQCRLNRVRHSEKPRQSPFKPLNRLRWDRSTSGLLRLPAGYRRREARTRCCSSTGPTQPASRTRRSQDLEGVSEGVEIEALAIARLRNAGLGPSPPGEGELLSPVEVASRMRHYASYRGSADGTR